MPCKAGNDRDRGLGLFTMNTLALFVICHQGSKIRRWEKVEWRMLPCWLEPWMILAMYVMATALWFVAWML